MRPFRKMLVYNAYTTLLQRQEHLYDLDVNDNKELQKSFESIDRAKRILAWLTHIFGGDYTWTL